MAGGPDFLPFEAGPLKHVDLSRKCIRRYIESIDVSFAEHFTVDLQWLELWWLIYHGFVELVLESEGKIG